MRTFLLVAGDFVRTGGMDMANLALARYLAVRGDMVHLVSHRVADDLARLPTVTVHHVPKPAGSYLLGEPLLSRVGWLWATRIARRGGRVIVNGGNCSWGDINWVHYVHAAYRGRPSMRHLTRLKQAIAHRRAVRRERVSVRKARVVIANSARTERDLTERLAVSPGIVHVVYCGIDAKRFHPRTPDDRAVARAHLGWSTDTLSLAFVGAVRDDRKGFRTLAAAWNVLCQKPSWDVDLAVVGDPTGAEHALETVVDADARARIRFLGFRRDVDKVLAACDGLISPVTYEPYGVAVQEALCSGLPALVTASAGIAERYPRSLQSLLIQDPESMDELCDRLRRWRTELDRLKVAALSVAATLRRDTWDVMAARIADVIEGG